MNRFTAQKVKLSLVGFAAVMLFWPALLSPCVVSSDSSKQAQIGAVLDEKLILFKRGALDTEMRVDLDTSKEDERAMSATSVSAAKQTRVVQFAGPIKRRWIDALRATSAEIVGYVPNYAYIIRGAGNELARVAALDARSDWDDAKPIRWMGRLLAVQKLDPEFTDEMLGATGTSVRRRLRQSTGWRRA